MDRKTYMKNIYSKYWIDARERKYGFLEYDKNLCHYICKNVSKEKRFAWFMDQYKNPKESTHTFIEVSEWFRSANIELLSSIPFSYTNNSLADYKLFEKRKNNPKLIVLLSEIMQAFSPQQIKEGGFFIMVGKKK